MEIPAGGGAQTTVTYWGLQLTGPYGVAVDEAGDVFIADTDNNRVVEVPAGGGPQTTVGSGLSSPVRVWRWMERAMSSSRTPFNNRVVEVPAGGGPQTTVGSGLH